MNSIKNKEFEENIGKEVIIKYEYLNKQLYENFISVLSKDFLNKEERMNG